MLDSIHFFLILSKCHQTEIHAKTCSSKYQRIGEKRHFIFLIPSDHKFKQNFFFITNILSSNFNLKVVLSPLKEKACRRSIDKGISLKCV